MLSCKDGSGKSMFRDPKWCFRGAFFRGEICEVSSSSEAKSRNVNKGESFGRLLDDAATRRAGERSPDLALVETKLLLPASFVSSAAVWASDLASVSNAILFAGDRVISCRGGLSPASSGSLSDPSLSISFVE